MPDTDISVLGGSRRVGLSIALLVILNGCGGYGDISPHGYEYATALYSICNRRDEARLESFSQQLIAAREAGELPEHEAEWMEEIIDLARNGEWEDAARKSRRILMDQVENGP
ncbi:MAG: hypothetical protein DWQ34_14655 [Planctomycetota bacterium]|nr:MAG: hypothetical protein DWQ34_14655 [Planctomycetota bacterium]REJ96504.1 MAG: hypothetical protein DWQ29_00745 [Planctomycetota bacterium]REK20547.1 MAG: hypothetical protein DWQ41_24980 [Planctomycetota bacterium]REK28301.1 MAG: hypothetical protein DWQ45_24890 [Planctomycetota bacterium]